MIDSSVLAIPTLSRAESDARRVCLTPRVIPRPRAGNVRWAWAGYQVPVSNADTHTKRRRLREIACDPRRTRDHPVRFRPGRRGDESTPSRRGRRHHRYPGRALLVRPVVVPQEVLGATLGGRRRDPPTAPIGRIDSGAARVPRRLEASSPCGAGSRCAQWPISFWSERVSWRGSRVGAG
jgi:hypothetical protein